MEKKNKKALIIGLSAACVVILAMAAFFVVTKLIKNPKARVGKGLSIMASELSEYDTAFSEIIDFAALYEKKSTLHTKTDVSVTVPNLETGNVSVGIDALINISEKKADCSIAAGMYGFKIDIGEAAATSDAIYVKSPMFLNNTYGFCLADIGRDFNNSPWPSILGKKLPDDLSLELFKPWNNDEPGRKITDIFSEKLEFLMENAIFENIKEKKGDFSGVRVTIGKDAQFVGLKTDCVLDFYFDKQGRIVNIAMPSNVETKDGAAMSVDINFTGDERAGDAIEGSAYFEKDGKSFDISYVNKFDMAEMLYDIEVDIKYDNVSFSFKADGGIEDIVKGGGCTFRVNNASLEMDSKEIFYASVVSEIEPSEKMPEIPESYVNLLEMNEIEIFAMIYEAASAIGKLGYEW